MTLLSDSCFLAPGLIDSWISKQAAEQAAKQEESLPYTRNVAEGEMQTCQVYEIQVGCRWRVSQDCD